MDTDTASSVALSFDWPNFGYFFRDVTTRHAERVAFRYRTRGERDFEEWSYARLGRDGASLVACLSSRGLGPGERVAIWSENRPEWCAAYFSLVAAGFVVVPVDILLPEKEAARVVEAAEASVLIASGKFTERLASALPPRARPRIAIGLDEAPSPDTAISVLSWTQAIAEGETWGIERGRSRAPSMPDPAGIEPTALASLIFTSGTTGKPKAVMLSHAGIIANVTASILALPVTEVDVFICVLPLHHTYPTTCSFLSPLAVGASITICEKVVGKVIVDDARDSGVTFMIGVPLLFDKLAMALRQGISAKPAPVRAAAGAMRAISSASLSMGLPGPGRALFKSLREASGLGRVRLMVSGGGPLSASTARAFAEFGFNLVQGYGMSENGPLISTNRPDRCDNRSVGLAVARTELRIAGEDTPPDSSGAAQFQALREDTRREDTRREDTPGSAAATPAAATATVAATIAATPAAVNRVGEIQVRSPSLMLGYWRDPEASAAIFTEDGWLRTGDLGRIDERGFIYITGRIKSLIVTTGGKNVHPEEIEALFEGSRIVREILVLGKAAATGGGEEVAAIVFPDLESIATDRKEISALNDEGLREIVKDEIARVNRALPPYKKVTAFHVKREEFEKTSSRKIKRFIYSDWEKATSR